MSGLAPAQDRRTHRARLTTYTYLILTAQRELLPMCSRAGLGFAESHEAIRKVVVEAAEHLGHRPCWVGAYYDELALLRQAIREGLN